MLTGQVHSLSGIASGCRSFIPAYQHPLSQQHLQSQDDLVGSPIASSKVYSYVECLETSPCKGWLPSNDTLRAFTSERAVNLSIAVQDATNAYSPKNFDSGYLDFPFDQAIQEWISQGGEPWHLIESVDGFHISQCGHAIPFDHGYNPINLIGCPRLIHTLSILSESLKIKVNTKTTA
ncbi:unnamed protein product [Rotaria socialis]|uniref:Uncharacterized protein n=1 Tax=Rotaria socialis TaxID=392032 RepID=A0A821KVU0_9BILA|nr:unnamed protein product [Rotaria socialis]